MSSTALGPWSFTEKEGFQATFSGLIYVHYSSSSYHDPNVTTVSYGNSNFYSKDGIISG